MVLFLHNRYRTTGGEERVVEDLLWLVRERLGEPAELLARDSAQLRAGRAALGLMVGGLAPGDVARAVRLTGARVVHAHNLQPALGWRALAAARAAGARVVVHLHQYRLVCAIGVCFTEGAECTRCHGRNTLPGVRHNCRASRPQALAYAASLALWQRRLVEQADAVVVPSVFARERLRELGAPLDWERVHVLAPPLRMLNRADAQTPPGSRIPAGTPTPTGSQIPAESPTSHDGSNALSGSYALVVSRLSPEKGVDVAIDACRMAGLALVVAGEGPERAALLARAAGGDVRLVGRVGDEELARLRAGAAIALAPSRSAETFGLAAAEAMAAGVPVAASRVGALAELVEREGLVPAGDADALARAVASLAGDRSAGERGRERVRSMCAPEVVAEALAAIYDGHERANGAPYSGPKRRPSTGPKRRLSTGPKRRPST
jgi:glycosyltransferase involved in cell wall biosynthesis